MTGTCARPLEKFLRYFSFIGSIGDRPAADAGFQLEDVGEDLGNDKVQAGGNLLVDFSAVIKRAWAW